MAPIALDYFLTLRRLSCFGRSGATLLSEGSAFTAWLRLILILDLHGLSLTRVVRNAQPAVKSAAKLTPRFRFAPTASNAPSLIRDSLG